MFQALVWWPTRVCGAARYKMERGRWKRWERTGGPWSGEADKARPGRAIMGDGGSGHTGIWDRVLMGQQHGQRGGRGPAGQEGLPCRKHRVGDRTVCGGTGNVGCVARSGLWSPGNNTAGDFFPFNRKSG